MKKNNIVGIVVMVVIGLLLCFAIPFLKEDEYEEQLLGIDYDINGNDTELNYMKDNPVAALYVENYGSIVMELLPEYAPNTVNNFIYLVKSGYYDDNTIHRLSEGFVLQGGDPKGEGYGSLEYNIKGEFYANGFNNSLSHTRGVVSMARATDYDTAGSQFFIVLGDATALDGQYAGFGKVIDGMKIIKKIEENEVVADKESGKLQRNLIIKKAVVDLNNYDYSEPEKITK